MKNIEQPIAVWVVWDPLLEMVISVHKSKEGADNKCKKLNEKDNRYEDNTYWYENAEFKLED